MKRTIVLAVIAAVAAILTWRWLDDGAEPVAVAPGPTIAASTPAPVDADPLRVPDAGGIDPRAAAAGDPQVDASAADARDPAACVVVGRLVDVRRAPIAGAAVRLYASKAWAEGVDVPKLPDPRYELRGYEVATSENGEFRIEAPAPPAGRATFKVRPGRFHDAHALSFGGSGPGARPALTAGVHDLGEIQLADTGALRGRVLDPRGAPIAGAEVGVGPTRTQTFGRDVTTASDGTFELGHAPVGTYGLKVSGEAHLSRFLEPVVVVAGSDTQVGDVVLSAAPTIEGVVVDERGAPLEGVKIWGWPASDGAGAGAKSDADGRFVVHLPQDESYSISAKLDGRMPWGAEHGDDGDLHAPGTRDLRVVMQPLPSTRFVVVDAETGAPIERFGLAVLADNGSQAPRRVMSDRRRPTAVDRPGGIAEASARVGVDLIVVGADDYLLAEDDVAHDVEGVPIQTVRLTRGAVVRGRLVRDGAPLADTVVEIVRTLRSGKPRSADGAQELVVDKNSRRSVVSGTDGAFEFRAVEAGAYVVTARPARAAPHEIRDVRVPDRGASDLGDVDVRPGGSIVGEILLPSGVEPEGIRVYVDDLREGPRAFVDASGRFRIDDVPAGARRVAHDERPGVLARGERTAVEVVSGGTASVTLDARAHALVGVEVRVTIDGLSAEGCRVALVDARDAPGREQLGKCDADGVARGSVRALGDAAVLVSLPGGRTLRHPTARVALVPTAARPIRAEVRYEFASLELRLAEPLPLEGHATLELVPDEAARGAQRVVVRIANRAFVADELVRVTPTGVVFEALVAGEHALSLEIHDASVEPTATLGPDGDMRIEHEPTVRRSARVTLAAGTKAEVAL